MSDKKVMTLTRSEDNLDIEVLHEWYFVPWYLTWNQQTDRLDLAIKDSQLNELVGEVVINEYNEEDHSMNFRILIGEKGRNRGLDSEATQCICDYVFKGKN